MLGKVRLAVLSACLVLGLGVLVVESPQLAAQTTERTPVSPPRGEANSGLPAPQVYEEVAPAVVLVEVENGFGSGVLTEIAGEKYVVTNAHVPWPYRTATVVFGDGSEFLDVPLVDWDLIADLALIGPLDTQVEPVALADGESLHPGETVYLIGYPGEWELFPQPSIARGLLSRLREWPTMDLTYLQTDALIAGGQSGGALVDAEGRVIGITFYRLGNQFALAISAADALARVEAMVADADPDGLGNRFRMIDDLDDGTTIQIGQEIVGAIDYWSDVDLFQVRLAAGDEVSVWVESAMIDAGVAIGPVDSHPLDMLADADSGGGPLGVDAVVDYVAPASGRYLIMVTNDFADESAGGYVLTVEPYTLDPDAEQELDAAR